MITGQRPDNTTRLEVSYGKCAMKRVRSFYLPEHSPYVSRTGRARHLHTASLALRRPESLIADLTSGWPTRACPDLRAQSPPLQVPPLPF